MPVTYFVALPFVRNEEGDLVPSEAQDRQSASAAESLARRMAETSAGAVPSPAPASRPRANSSAVVIRSFGEVPTLEDLLSAE